jgi:hypothetical protein
VGHGYLLLLLERGPGEIVDRVSWLD